MQEDAHRIFQWITMSSQPLGLEEVAEVFAINFDEENCGIPKFEPSWRDANAETAVLSACSTLVTIVVEHGWPHRKIVQFSHFSVKEYLTSDRIANAGHISRFYIHSKPAHTILAKACLSVLLHLDYSIDEAKIKNFPLAEYAAKHWVGHAEFEDVSWCIRDGMDLLFDKDQPHFATWVWIYDINRHGHSPKRDIRPEELDRVPLYYAALCGFGGLLVERLLTARPQDLDAKGGIYGAPLNAALAKGHLDIAQFLLDHGAVGDNACFMKQTGLYIASSRGYADVVRSLIDRGADLNAKCRSRMDRGRDVKWTPLHAAIDKEHRDIVLLLLKGGPELEIRSSRDETALYMASSRGCVDIVRQLVGHGADPNAKCRGWMQFGLDLMDLGLNLKWTPLHAAINKGHRDIVLLLLEGGADPEIRSSQDETALYMASSRGCVDIVRQLVSHGADPNAKSRGWMDHGGNVKWAPLHVATYKEYLDIVLLLLEGGADPETRSSWGQTALYMASSHGCVNIARQLIDHGADPNAKCRGWMQFGLDLMDLDPNLKWTPLHAAIYKEHRDIVLLLLAHGANPEIRSSKDETALYMASSRGCVDIVRQLISHGADPNAECETFRSGCPVTWTPLHAASHHGMPEIARMLLERGANPNTLDHSGGTALHLTEEITVVDLLLEYGVNVDVRDEEGWTPLHKAAYHLKLQVAVVLLDRSANPHALTNKGETPFRLANSPASWASKEDQSQIVQLLSERTGETI
jgi:ankyrin repeat protein